MYSRASIYDRLQGRAPTGPEQSEVQPKQFDTRSIIVRDCWLAGGFGAVEDVSLEGMVPAACDYTFDSRLRDQKGYFIGVSRMDVGQEPEFGPIDRARQLLSHILSDIAIRGDERDKQVVLQVPPGVESELWLDTALELWPIQYQPQYGILVTSQSFDRWLQTIVALDESPVEHYQFVAVSPLVPDSTSTVTPKGEAVASIWLQRVPVHGADASSSRLLLPVTQEHCSRNIAARWDSSALKNAAVDLLRDNCDCDEIGVVVWDGLVSDSRLDHLMAFLQSDFEHLYMDTDVWPLQALCGSIDGDPLPYMATLAFKLCESRNQSVLILDSHRDSDTAAMLLRHHETKAT